LETYTKVFGDKWDPLQRGALERKMGEAFYRKGEPEKGLEYLQRALVYFGRPKLPTSRSKVRLGILREIGMQLAHRLLPRSLAKRAYGPAGQAVEEVGRLYQIVATHDAVAVPERGLLVTLTALNFAEQKGHLPGIADPYVVLITVCYFFSLFRLGRSLLHRAVVLTRQTQNPSALAGIYGALALTENNAGQLDQAIRDILYSSCQAQSSLITISMP
jgi:hypothetical protein